MKKVFYLFALLALISCSTEDKPVTSVLSGSAHGLEADYILLREGRNTDTLALADDGTFSISKNLEKPGNFYLFAGKNRLEVYLAPGYNLDLNFNAENFDSTLVFEGDLAAENSYLLKLGELNRELSSNMRDLYAGPAEEYRSGVESIMNSKVKLLESYRNENPGISEEFVRAQMLNYEFSFYSSLSQYIPAHKYYAKVEEVELPENWYDFENKININNPEYMNVPVALGVIGSIINKNIEKNADVSSDEDWGTAKLLGAQFDYILNNIENQDMINYFLNQNISTVVDYSGTAGIEDYVQMFYENSTDQEAIDALKEKEEMWAPLKAGEPAPLFTIPDIDGNMVSLSDFKGQYVYINFWATWCGPCKIEIPVLDELAVNYADKNIKIISISVDQDKQAWIDMVTRDKPQWLQLHDGINMNDDYLVRYIPTFVLIDRDGKFINARAPRPSSGEKLTELLNSLEGI